MTETVLVAYATRYGSTKEVAETVAATLVEQGFDVEVKAAREVRSLDGLGGIVLGRPLYMGALHKGRARLARAAPGGARAEAARALRTRADLGRDGVDGSRKQLDAALAKLPWLSPVATEVFVGKYDPPQLASKTG